MIFFLVLRPLVPIIDYAVNYQYISEVLCINKDRPEVHCKGKCYLSKELTKASQEDSENHKTKNRNLKILDFFISTEPAKLHVQHLETIADIPFNTQKEYSYLLLRKIFKPPIF